MKCWECRRRRRVCNAKLPCHQCKKDGITCSGYGSKPVTFLPIGMRSRHRRGEEDDAVDSGRPTDRPTVRASIVAHASVPRDLVRQQDVYFVNAANFCTLYYASGQYGQLTCAHVIVNDHRKKLFSATIYDNHGYFEDIPSSSPALPPSLWHSVTAMALLFHGNAAGPCPADRAILRARMLHEKQLAIRDLVDEISVEKGGASYFTMSSIYCLAQTDVSLSIY